MPKLLLLMLALVALLPGSSLQAARTAPTLAIFGVESVGAEHGTLLRIRGVFPDEALVQQAYPLTVFVRDLTTGTDFICFSPIWGGMRGSLEAIANGVSPLALTDALTSATPEPTAVITNVGPGRIDLLLPADVPGDVEVSLVVSYRGSTLLSNAYRVATQTSVCPPPEAGLTALGCPYDPPDERDDEEDDDEDDDEEEDEQDDDDDDDRSGSSSGSG